MRRFWRFVTVMASICRRREAEQVSNPRQQPPASETQAQPQYPRSPGGPDRLRVPPRPVLFPRHWSHQQVVEYGLAEIILNQQRTYEWEKKMSKALDDLKEQVSGLSTDLDDFIQNNAGGATDADLQGVTAAVVAMRAKVAAPAPTV